MASWTARPLGTIEVTFPEPKLLVPSQAEPKTVPSWQQGTTAQSGPFGPILGIELAEAFSELRPCTVKVTAAQDKPEFR